MRNPGTGKFTSGAAKAEGTTHTEATREDVDQLRFRQAAGAAAFTPRRTSASALAAFHLPAAPATVICAG